GLMSPSDPAAFRPDDALTAQALEDLVFSVRQTLAAPATGTPTTTSTTPAAPVQVADPGRPVTLARLDTRLVQALGLAKAAQELSAGARAAGLNVPGRFGTEAAAPPLGLRFNPPAQGDPPALT